VEKNHKKTKLVQMLPFCQYMYADPVDFN